MLMEKLKCFALSLQSILWQEIMKESNYHSPRLPRCLWLDHHRCSWIKPFPFLMLPEILVFQGFPKAHYSHPNAQQPHWMLPIMWFHPLHPSQFQGGLFSMDGGRDSPTNRTNPPPFIGDVPMFSHWNLHLWGFSSHVGSQGFPQQLPSDKKTTSRSDPFSFSLPRMAGRGRTVRPCRKGVGGWRDSKKKMNGMSMYRSSHGMGFHQSISVYNFGFIISEIANDSNIIYTYQDPFSGSTIFTSLSFLKSDIPFGVVPVRPVKQRNFVSCHQRQLKGNWRVSRLR